MKIDTTDKTSGIYPSFFSYKYTYFLAQMQIHAIFNIY